MVPAADATVPDEGRPDRGGRGPGGELCPQDEGGEGAGGSSEQSAPATPAAPTASTPAV